MWDTDKHSFADLENKLRKAKSGISVFTFGNTRINYKENTVSSAVFLTNYVTPKPEFAKLQFLI